MKKNIVNLIDLTKILPNFIEVIIRFKNGSSNEKRFSQNLPQNHIIYHSEKRMPVTRVEPRARRVQIIYG